MTSDSSKSPERASPEPRLRAVASDALRPGTAKLLEALQELGVGVADLADEAAARMREQLESGGESIGERAVHGTFATRERAGELLKRTEAFVRERPLTAIGLAFLAGYLISSRR